MKTTDGCGGGHSPACISSVVMMGFMRGELRDMWEWVDGGRQGPGSGVADRKSD